MKARVIANVVFLRHKGRPVTVLPGGLVVGARRPEEKRLFRRVAEKARRLEKEITSKPLEWAAAQWREVN